MRKYLPSCKISDVRGVDFEPLLRQITQFRKRERLDFGLELRAFQQPFVGGRGLRRLARLRLGAGQAVQRLAGFRGIAFRLPVVVFGERLHEFGQHRDGFGGLFHFQ